ncbi:MAG: DUF1501 domain-containing protein [Planctomycetota bacterium]|nr:DUF1501 domain-containing protein [Planctomycetota bacterium]
MSTRLSAHSLSRRRFLHTGSMLSLGLGLSQVMRMRAATASETPPHRSDTAVILVWLTGGLSHMDTYDLKPEAPLEYRGEFSPIRTNVSGIQVGELLPLHAKIADKFSLIRSVSHGFADHDGAHKRILTGRIPKSAVGFVNDAPSVGCIVNKVREQVRPDMLSFTSGQRADTNADSYSQGAGYLGKSYEPFLVVGDPSDEKWSVPNLAVVPELAPRLSDRRSLLAEFDSLRREIDLSESLAAADHFQSKALALLTSDAARRAFDVSQEEPALRDRYGRNAYGQQALLARRLVEAGTSFANVVMEHPGGSNPPDAVYNWDCHAVNCHVFNDARWRFPPFDQAVSALIEDIYSRGLDRKVLIVVTGEFGHTPRISYQKGTGTGIIQPGRDHWPGAMSILVSGGGLRMGQVVGSTNRLGEAPQDRPLSPNALWATVYRHLGIDTQQSFPDHSGRPMPILPDGEPIRDLI